MLLKNSNYFKHHVMGLVQLSVLVLLSEHWEKMKTKVLKRLTVFGFLTTH